METYRVEITLFQKSRDGSERSLKLYVVESSSMRARIEALIAEIEGKEVVAEK